jgi:tetratricopeptide (TPR) repeat protein
MDIQRFNHAMTLRDAGKTKEALQELVELEQLTPDMEERATILGNQINCLSILGRRDEAVQVLVLARRIAPKTQIHLYLDLQEAGLLLHAGEPGKALKILDDLERHYKAILAAPEHENLNMRTHICRGAVLEALGRYREACLAFEDSLRLHLSADDEQRVLYNLGLCCRTLGEEHRAKQALQGAIENGLQGNNAVSAHYLLGTIYSAEKAYAKALLEFEWCLAHVEEGRIPKKHICEWLVSTTKTLGMKEPAGKYERLAKG